jgi:UDP-N-acetyl-2-amino-2-deoxyglucuronate dehydrogenase
MSKLRTGVIGTGKVAHTHANVLKVLGESECIAACSRNTERVKAFTDKHGLTGYTDVHEMVSCEKLDVVLNTTPHPAHAATTISALEAGAHVMVEKPLASSLEDCDAMIACAKRMKRNVGMISQRRLYEPVARVKQAIDDGKIGQPILATVTMLGWRDQAYYESDPWRGKWDKEGGGVLVNQAPHQLDLLQWFMGPIESLYGLWGNLNHPTIEVEDTAVAVIRFKNGALGNILVSNSQNPALHGKVHVFGENGAAIGVQTDGGAMFVAGMSKIEEPPLNDIWTVPGEEAMLETWRQADTDVFKTIDATEYYHQLQIQQFLQAVIQNTEPAVSGEEGRKTVELFTAIYRSMRDKAPVCFPLETLDGKDDFDGRLN